MKTRSKSICEEQEIRNTFSIILIDTKQNYFLQSNEVSEIEEALSYSFHKLY